MLPAEIRLHIREVRDHVGLRLRDLEEAGAGSKSYWQRAETGTGDLSVYKLLRLAQLANTSPWGLVEYVAWPVPTPCTCPCHTHREG